MNQPYQAQPSHHSYHEKKSYQFQQSLVQNNNNINNVLENSKVHITKFPSNKINNYNNDYQISKNTKIPNIYITSEKEYSHHSGSSRNPNLNINQKYQINQKNQNLLSKRVPNINQIYHQSKIQMSKIPYMDENALKGKGGYLEDDKNSNKNIVEKYFHDDYITQPIVCEGETLFFFQIYNYFYIKIQK